VDAHGPSRWRTFSNTGTRADRKVIGTSRPPSGPAVNLVQKLVWVWLVARTLADLGDRETEHYRTLAAEFGLLDQGTPPERMADEAIPKLMAAVPEGMRPAVVGLLHLGYGALEHNQRASDHAHRNRR
jgi:hypothetical protein